MALCKYNMRENSADTKTNLVEKGKINENNNGVFF